MRESSNSSTDSAILQVLIEIKQLLLIVTDVILEQEEEQEPTEYLDGTPL